MKLKATYMPLAMGKMHLEIEGYGTFCIYSDNGNVGCERSKEAPDITLDALSSARYIFGPYPPVYTSESLPLADAWFPLPLSWNSLDRL